MGLKRIYHVKHVLAATASYAAMAAAAYGAVLVAPVWAVAAGVALAGGISWLGIRANKKFIENNLQRYDAVEGSPNLMATVKDLYERSGLKSEDYPLYDFKVDDNKPGVKRKGIGGMLREAFNKSATTLNAAAAHLGKPVIMISTPLLHVLDEEEEKAVLAHEFAHAAARHQHVGLPHRTLSSMATLANGLSRLAGLFAAGATAIFAGIGSGIAAGIGAAILLKKNMLAGKPSVLMTRAEKREQADRKRIVDLVSSTVTAGVVAAFSAPYLFIYAATKGLDLVLRASEGALSRAMEFQADRGAAVLGANPLALITALRKIELVRELDDGALPKRGWLMRVWDGIDKTHPSHPRRFRQLARIARKQGYTQEQIDTALNGVLDIPARPPASAARLQWFARNV